MEEFFPYTNLTVEGNFLHSQEFEHLQSSSGFLSALFLHYSLLFLFI